MADDDQGTAVVNQVSLQPGNGLNIQVVGRLVQDQQLWLFQKHLSQRQTGILPARQLRNLHLPHGLVKLEAIQNRSNIGLIGKTALLAKVL